MRSRPSAHFPPRSAQTTSRRKGGTGSPIAWTAGQACARERYWPDVERCFGGLPPRVFRQAKLLEYDLALRHSDSGQFRDVFLGVEQLPILSICGWLLDDLGVGPDRERDRVEGHLFLASVLLAARTHVIGQIPDPESFYDHGHLALVQLFSERAVIELARVIPQASPFWREYDAISTCDLDDVLADLERDRGAATAGHAGRSVGGAWSGPARTLGLAALNAAEVVGTADERTRARSAAIAPLVGDMLDHLAAAFQIRSDLAMTHRDLQRGRATFPIEQVARAARVPLRPWPPVDVMLGAMVVTGSLPVIVGQAVGRLREAEQIAVELGLATFAAYLHDAAAALEDRSPDIARSTARGTSETPAAPLVRLAEPGVPKALAMARGFLLSERTFRESWETHREGMFRAPEVASRFPAGLILETLAEHGDVLTEEVDAFRAFTAANGFRYYDHPWSDVDSDTVGVFLRLQHYATRADDHAAVLDDVLVRLADQTRRSGGVPVWIAGEDPASDPRPPILTLGEGCGTVAAHLLLGLIAVAPASYADTIEIGAVHLLDRIGDVRLGANVNYPPLYALARFARLIAWLDGHPTEIDVGGRTVRARGVLDDELRVAIGRGALTAQQAALLTIACLEMGEPRLVDADWATTILKGQRFDGSWPGEPFAAAPNRGSSVTWYSSTILTSALCYDALMRRAPATRGRPPQPRRDA